MEKIFFFDAKPYDKYYFDNENEKYGYELIYVDAKCSAVTAGMVENAKVVCAFVNDSLEEKTLQILQKRGIRLLAMRCAGYNNIDLDYARGKIDIVRVPAYSPHAVAEHAMAMLLTLNRKLHKSYIRVRDNNFSLNGLTGFDLYGKTVGVIGTGKIGQAFCQICKGFGMKVLAYDPYPLQNSNIAYVSLEELCRRSHVISLHCPLTKESHHIINEKSLSIMRNKVYLINTSRGALVDSEALLCAIKSGKVGAAALDVYEEEEDIFYEDNSGEILRDDILARLISMPNVLVTSHQAFLTEEALEEIARTTMKNIAWYLEEGKIVHGITE